MLSNSGNLLIVNGKILPSPPWKKNIRALAIRAGKVIAHGEQALQLKSEYAVDNTTDVKGAVVLPGFADGHIHLTALAESLNSLTFSETSTLEQIRDTVAEAVTNRPDGEWIIGGKWSLDALHEFPDKAVLDPVTPNTPVVLHSKDLHSIWLNSKALEILDITIEMPDPDGGRIRRDSSGEPTGVLQENAVRLFEERRSPRDVETFASLHEQVAAHCHQYGITAAHSIELMDDWRLYQNLHENGKLRLRIGGLLPVDHLEEVIRHKFRSGDGDNWLWTIGIKMFTDGALGSRTAWIKTPYENSTNRGIPLISEKDLTEIITRCHQNALSVGVHAIGDAAVGMTLNAINTSKDERAGEQFLDRIEHLQLIDPEDLENIPAGLIASMQPVHLPGDRSAAAQFWGERSRYAYAFQSLEKHGVILAFGSDAPVETIDPWLGIQAAVERRIPDEEEAWNSREKISLEEAITAYTVNNARAAYRDAVLGTLEVGAGADAVVLNRDPWAIPETELKTERPVMTILNGNVIFADGAA